MSKKFPLASWNKSDIEAFERGMKIYPKDFGKIKKLFMGKCDKTVKDLVEYYYTWKKSFRFSLWRTGQLQYEHEYKRKANRIEEEESDNGILLSPLGSPDSTFSESSDDVENRDTKRRKVQIDSSTSKDESDDTSFWDENSISNPPSPFAEIPILGIASLSDSLCESLESLHGGYKWSLPVDETFSNTECDFISDIFNSSNDPEFPY